MTHAVEHSDLVRRQPVQERSRRTVTSILDAAEAIVDEHGVNAATTRAIADRAGVSYPSLYRFFNDRDQILDQLLERHTRVVDKMAEEAEATWPIHSAVDLLDAELNLHIAYYRDHPSAARLWLAGRVTPVVTEFVHRRVRTLAGRLHRRLIDGGHLPTDTDPQAILLLVELSDRVTELAYRGRDDFDENLLALGRSALAGYLTSLAQGH